MFTSLRAAEPSAAAAAAPAAEAAGCGGGIDGGRREGGTGAVARTDDVEDPAEPIVAGC